MLKSRFVAVFIFLLVAGNIFAQKDTVSFLHITDLHLMFNTENYDRDIVNHRWYTRKYKGSVDSLSKFLSTIPDKTGGDMVIATGDILDFHDAKTVSGNSFAYQVEPFARFMDGFIKPVFFSLGNHDVFSYEWGNVRVNANQLKAGQAKAAWIRNFDCFRDGTYYSRVIEVGNTTYRLIFLDNSFYQFKEAENMVNPYIDKAQLHWLQSELDASEEDVEIIFMHIPFTPESALPESGNELYKALTSVSSVRLIFSGHYHRDKVKRFPQLGGKEIFQVETGALVAGVDNWRLIQLTESNILVSYSGTLASELVIPSK